MAGAWRGVGACSYGKRKGWRVGQQLDLELWMLCLGIWTLSKGFTRMYSVGR